jgi:hypothetical protein
VLPSDQRGIPRPQGPACDLGAAEMTVPSPASQFFTLAPCRRVDTRSGAPLACGVNHAFTLTGGACGVPAGAGAVAVNVTVTQPSSQGNVNVLQGGTSPPITAILNYLAGGHARQQRGRPAEPRRTGRGALLSRGKRPRHHRRQRLLPVGSAGVDCRA